MFVAVVNFLIHTYGISFNFMLIGFLLEILLWLVCAFGYIINLQEE